MATSKSEARRLAVQRPAKKDPVKELFSIVQTLRREPDTAKRPNKWRAQYVRDVGAMLTRYNNVAKKLAAAEAKIKSLTE